MTQTATPWGPSQGATQTDVPGIVFHWTAGHGGYFVADALGRRLEDKEGACIGAGIRMGGGTWWEEDCAWAFVARAFPAAFPAEAVEAAEQTIAWLERDADTRPGDYLTLTSAPD